MSYESLYIDFYKLLEIQLQYFFCCLWLDYSISKTHQFCGISGLVHLRNPLVLVVLSSTSMLTNDYF